MSRVERLASSAVELLDERRCLIDIWKLSDGPCVVVAMGGKILAFTSAEAKRVADAMYKMARAIERGKVEDDGGN